MLNSFNIKNMTVFDYYKCIDMLDEIEVRAFAIEKKLLPIAPYKEDSLLCGIDWNMSTYNVVCVQFLNRNDCNSDIRSIAIPIAKFLDDAKLDEYIKRFSNNSQ